MVFTYFIQLFYYFGHVIHYFIIIIITIIIIIIMGILLNLFYQFGHIILFSVEHGNMSMFIAFHVLLDSEWDSRVSLHYRK
jgi:cytochrome c biogenesis protein CcdA